MKWSCQKCGSCCRFVFDTHLDSGNGICKHLKDNLCLIYDTRPPECRVDNFQRTDSQLIDACNKLRQLRKEIGE